MSTGRKQLCQSNLNGQDQAAVRAEEAVTTLLSAPHRACHESLLGHVLQAISSLRAALSGMADDQGILGASAVPNLTPVNTNAYTFSRTPAQVCSPVPSQPGIVSTF